MGKTGSTRRNRTSHGGDQCSKRCAHIKSNHHGGGLRKRDRPDTNCSDRRGNTRAGRLCHQGDAYANADQQQTSAPGVRRKGFRRDLTFQAGHTTLHHFNAHKDQREPGQCYAPVTRAALGEQIDEYAHQRQWHDQRSQVELESQQRDHPTGNSGAYVGTKQDPQGLRERQQPGVNKADRSHAGRAG